MPCLSLWSQCPRELSWSPACNTSAKPCLHWHDVMAVIHSCWFHTHQMHSVEMAQLWTCSGKISPGKTVFVSLHPGQLSCWLPTACGDNFWQLLSSAQGPATLFLMVGFSCELEGSISDPCCLVCPWRRSLTVPDWWSLPHSGALLANGGCLCPCY